jgi:dTDP-4-dehydrorhamnose reductase
MKLLLFGASGQLGQEIQALATDRSFAVRAVRRSHADLACASQVEPLFHKTAPDVIVNAAAYTKVDLAESERELAFRANAQGPAVLADACGRHGIPLIHVSTDYVFDGHKAGPYVETDAPAPLGIYGASKLKGEHAIVGRLAEHVILRTAWVYGRHGRNFLKTMLGMADRPALKVVADQHGNPTATIDLAAAVLGAAELAAKGRARWGIYHFAGSGAATWHDFAVEIFAARAEQAGPGPRILPIMTEEFPTAARRPRNSRLDSSLFARHFGISALSWRQRTHETVRSLLGTV